MSESATELLVKCCSCESIFSDLNELYKHVREDCDLETALNNNSTPLNTQNKLIELDSQLNFEKRIFICRYCDKKFNRRYDHDEHVRSHTGEKPFECEICSKGFSQRSNYRRHMKTHKVLPFPVTKVPIVPLVLNSPESQSEDYIENNINVVLVNGFQCQFCEVLFSDFSSYRSHLVTHSNLKHYKCIHNPCEHTFERLKDYLNHLSSEHKEVDNNVNIKEGTNFKCSQCKAKFKTRKGFQNHLQTTSHELKCQICEKGFNSEINLRRHLREHRSPSTKYPCNVCGNVFRSLFYLKSHLLIHTGELPFHCDLCPAKFNRRDKLKRHELIHLDKRYNCPFALNCKKSFVRIDKLKDHLLHHVNENDLSCNECLGTFASFTSLKKHIHQDHTNEGKLKCPECDQTFSMAKSYQSHVQKTHGMIKCAMMIDFVQESEDPSELIIYVPVDEKSGDVLSVKDINLLISDNTAQDSIIEPFNIVSEPIPQAKFPEKIDNIFSYEDSVLNLLESSLDTNLFP
ncbi:zinc finger Y-chromosomal protein [Lepeophtheirus salmonis]|uniref:zinc finger Y-chromosomal protein n=1 Tax=Lepeophtheirus salmonis TaxID=72036 RepID=UPI001AE7A2B5|nr:zinc finger protein 83-like [Lepeophtheirus salmonis]